MEYKIEDIIQGKEQLLKLATMCWDEVDQAGQEGINFDPDWDTYNEMNKLGHIRYYTAYDRGEFKGFAIFLIVKSLHFKGKFIGMSDSIYLVPECRSKGAEFLNLIIDDLKEEGVHWFSLNIKAWLDTGNLSTKIGCTHYENVLQRRLQ